MWVEGKEKGGNSFLKRLQRRGDFHPQNRIAQLSNPATERPFLLRRRLCGPAVIKIGYIEDITWPRGDMKFLFEKRNFVSPSDHVILFLLYKIYKCLKKPQVPESAQKYCELTGQK